MSPHHLQHQLPGRPRLLPGVEVHRRDAHHLQVGFDHRAVTLTDTPDVRRLLETWELPDPPPTSVLLALVRLADADLLVDAEVLQRCYARADGPLARAAAAATVCEDPRGAAERWDRRAAGLVRVDAGPADRSALARVLGASGVASAPDEGLRRPGEVVVLVGDREPDRERLDALLQADVPHLLVRSDLDHVVVGPFVQPGRTACVRCLDAHLADHDPRRPLVLEQHVRSDATAPRDPALHQVALGWAARDLVRWLEGERPSTWSATVRIGPTMDTSRRAWLRHPHCGCGWADLDRSGHQSSESSLPSIERRFSREQVSQ